MDAGPSAVVLFVRESASNARSRTLVLNPVSGVAGGGAVTSAVILFVRRAGFECAITHTGVECRLWRRSDHVRRNFVRSQTGFQCAITHTGSKSRLLEAQRSRECPGGAGRNLPEMCNPEL